VRDGDVPRIVERLAERFDFQPTKVFGELVQGFAAELPIGLAKQLAKDPAVETIVADDRMAATAVVPTGIRRVFATSSALADIDGVHGRPDVDVAVLDSGIGPHSDITVAGGYDCNGTPGGSWADDNGHGTHVAGTIAAKDGSSGIVGVAPGARLWSVKVLDHTGYGDRSDIICGLEWVATQADPDDPDTPLIEVVNMSVAGPGSDDGNCGYSNLDVLHQMACWVVSQGTVIVAAAANDRRSAATVVPAAYDEVITVSALADTDGRPGSLGGPLCYSWGSYDQDDTFADFSNYGPDVDLIAPGKCIYSSFPGDRYGYLSGTSMAAPHVAGAAALYMSSRREATPDEVRTALRYLGNHGWKTWTDRDNVHEPLLDLSRLGPLGSFNLSITPARPVFDTEGGTGTVIVHVIRSTTFFEGIDLSVSRPWGSPIQASMVSSRIYGFSATTVGLRLEVPPGVAPGRYWVTIRAAYHSLVRTLDVPVDVTDVVVVGHVGLTRLAGADRYATSAAISRATFSSGVAVAYVATGASFPDALTGAAVAARDRGPVLLVQRDRIPAAVATELARLKPRRIVILGGTGVVGSSVAAALDAYTTGAVTRLAGTDRYATAVAISRASFDPGVKTVFVATGTAFPDALAGAAVAGARGSPLLLVPPTSLPSTVRLELARLSPDEIVILGGSAAVSDAVAAALGGYGIVFRLAGADRYATSAFLSQAAYPTGAMTAYVATGATFPDAVAGAAVAGRAGAPILLVERDRVPSSVATELGRLEPARILVLGGPGAISNAVQTTLQGYLGL
jgi:subtilisin family serine protease/putative cell wall-binding protein